MGIETKPSGELLTWIKGAAGRILAPVRNLLQSHPTIKLSYFDEALAVELHAINERRRRRHDARHHHAATRASVRKLDPGEQHHPGDHPRPLSKELPTPQPTPETSVDPQNLTLQRMRARPIPCTAVGVALSGGGIRSAAFSLGALQALDFHHVIVHTDYLSTVSGGGYIGACVTASMSNCKGVFPFGTSDVRDNDAIGHLRNYSNYLLPRAHSQLRNGLEAAAVILRGLVANALLVFVYLLAAALLTSIAYPAWADLPSGNFVPNLFWGVLVKVLSGIVWLMSAIASLLPASLHNDLRGAGAFTERSLTYVASHPPCAWVESFAGTAPGLGGPLPVYLAAERRACRHTHRLGHHPIESR